MTAPKHDHAGPGLWIGLALGVPIIGWGVRGILLDHVRTHPAELGRWIVGSAVVHDAAVLPVVVVIGLVARRAMPPGAWPATRWALATTGVVALVAWPFVRAYGRRPDNPSLLPRNYGLGLVVALGVVWLTAGALVLLARRRPSPPAD